VSMEISPEIEARLTDEARKLGISVDTLLKRLIDDRAQSATSVRLIPELPVWHLGAIGALHRRDIYDDVR
jgi:hypothetical protein